MSIRVGRDDTLYFEGEVDRLVIKGRRSVHIIGGNHKNPLYSSETKVNEFGDVVWADALRGSSFSKMLITDITDQPCFSGGMNGCSFNDIYFRDIKTAFDFTTIGIKGSSTWNTLNSCNFRTTGTSLLTQWPVFLNGCMFEGKLSAPRERDAAVCVHLGSASTYWRGCTFERVGVPDFIFDFPRGTHYFEGCRFGNSPNCNRIFRLGGEAKVHIIRSQATDFADLSSLNSFRSQQYAKPVSRRIDLSNNNSNVIFE